jgi:LysR family glycine cleavage system transcriptional activator
VRPNDWHTWFSSTGESYGIVKRHLSITGADIAFHAALEGIGVALGRVGFIEPYIESGHLVTPLDIRARGKGGFYLAYPDTALARQYRDWFIDTLKAGSVRSSAGSVGAGVTRLLRCKVPLAGGQGQQWRSA